MKARTLAQTMIPAWNKVCRLRHKATKPASATLVVTDVASVMRSDGARPRTESGEVQRRQTGNFGWIVEDDGLFPCQRNGGICGERERKGGEIRREKKENEGCREVNAEKLK